LLAGAFATLPEMECLRTRKDVAVQIVIADEGEADDLPSLAIWSMAVQ